MKSKLLFIIILFLINIPVIIAQQAKWTIMVYLDGDNNLESAGISDVNEMEQVGSTNDVNILVQFDRTPDEDASNGDWTDTRRFRIIKDNDQQNISSPVLQNLGEVNMGDPNSLINFVKWAAANYPAQNYCLVLWDHGGGWKTYKNTHSGFRRIDTPGNSHLGRLSDLINDPSGGIKEPKFTNPFASGFGIIKDVCYDDTDDDHLSSDEVGKALDNLGIKINVLGYDACLMAMIENAYEVRDKVDYMIASEETEPGDGWPYHTVLGDLVQNPNMTPADFSKAIVNEYKNYYTNFSDDTQTSAAFDMSKLSPLINSLGSFLDEILNVKPWTQIGQVYMNVDYYYNRTSIDLYDFVNKLNGTSVSANLVSKGNDLKQAIKNFVINNYNESGHVNANGLSVYFPLKSDFNPNYSNSLLNIDFPADTKWDEFLSAYYNEGTNSDVFDPYEPNDNFSQSYGPITSGYTYKGFIQENSDVDIFKFTTGSTFNLDINLKVPADLDLLLAVKQDNSYYKVDSSYSDGVVDEKISRTGLPAGEYFIMVLPYQVSDLPYELTANITGGSGQIDLELSYDDGEPDYGIYSNVTYFSEGVACLFRLPVAPAKLKGLEYYVYNIDNVPGSGDNGSFWVFGSDFYGSFIPNDYLYYTPQYTGWNYVDLSQYDITLYSDFFAGMFWDTYNTPAIGWDTSATNGLNLVYTQMNSVQDWYVANGTFFIRAVISVNNEVTEAGQTLSLKPASYSLDNAFPNPFNPATTIQYEIPVRSNVSIKVFDMLGREVATLVNEQKSAGKYQAVFNAQSLPSGIYFYKLKAGSFSETKKLVLLK